MNLKLDEGGDRKSWTVQPDGSIWLNPSQEPDWLVMCDEYMAHYPADSGHDEG